MTEHSTEAQHGEHGGGEHGHGEAHGASLRTFGMVFLGLCILTFTSFGWAHVFHSTPLVSWVGMMAISCCKALLVISFFMHLIWEANWKYVLTIPASLMSILIVLMLIPDIGRRTRNYSEERWRNAPAIEIEHAAEDSHTSTAEDHAPSH